ncbi:MAG: AAA domain-containing protein, partial [Candidatus Kapaibacterium sp.]
ILKYQRQAQIKSSIVLSLDNLNFVVKYSSLIIQKISSIEIAQELQRIIDEIPELRHTSPNLRKHENIDLYRAVIHKNPFYRKKIIAHYAEFVCNHEDLGEFSLKVGYPYLANAAYIAEGICFNLINAEIIHDEPLTLAVHHPGLIILEPDYLIDATDLAESYGLPDAYKIYFLKRYFRTDISYPLVMGNLINSIFDELILNPDVDFNTARSNAFRNKPLQLIVMYLTGKIKQGMISSELEFFFNRIKNIYYDYLQSSFDGAVFSVEASFISPVYGIQGRLDLLAEYPNDKKRKDIVELKSGSAPSVNYQLIFNEKRVPVGVWQNHLAQVTAYNLLLESAFEGRKGNSSILYVKANEKPLRDVAKLIAVLENMIVHRNNIILLENAILSGSFKFFENIDRITCDGVPAYIADKVVLFRKYFENYSDLEKSYFLNMTLFILRESYSLKIGFNLPEGINGYSSLWLDSIEDKSADYSILCDLTLLYDDSDFDNMHLKFEIQEDEVNSSFRKGDMSILLPQNDDNMFDGVSNQLIKCSIKEINSKNITVSIRNKLIAKEIFNVKQTWRLEPDSIDSIDKLSYSSIFTFLNSDTKFKELIFGIRKPDFSNKYIIDGKGLNDNQKEIISGAVNAKDYFIIQGPPGTGKTSIVLKRVIAELISNTDTNILITAYTNRAVDEIASSLESLGTDVDYIRIGSKDATEMTSHHLPSIIENEGLKKAMDRLASTRLIISTVASVLTNQEIFELKKFGIIIIDEAGQILEPQIVGLLSRVDRFILIGDEKQLPPIVIQNKDFRNCDDDLLNQIGLFDFGESLFSRLLNICKKNLWVEAYGLLKSQGRMHKEIQDFSGTYFYDSELEPATDSQLAEITLFNSESNNKLERILAKNRFFFIDCPPSNVKINKYEASLSLELINLIGSSTEINKSTIGVISPFRAQCFEIKKMLNDKYRDLITIDTVERYQGSQRDFIILSMATGSSRLLEKAVSIDYTGKVDRKLNVSLTRAKSHVIILGSSTILRQSPHYRLLLDYLKNNEAIYYFDDLK